MPEQSKSMKRFMLFWGDAYYPAGGMNDYGGSFNTQEEALQSIRGKSFDWAHVYDVEEDKEIVLK